jgi:DNA gyrase/topoisomerase IV subunit A
MSEDEYIAKTEEYGDGAFTAIMGAEGIRDLLRSIDIDREGETIRLDLKATGSDPKIKKYANVTEILEEYCTMRLELYTTRKDGQLKQMRHEERVLDNKIRFIQAILNETIVLKGKDEETLEKELDRLQFMRVDGKYDYLLSIQVRSMTAKRLADLQHELEQLRKAIKTLEKITPADLWLQELKALEKEL